MQPCGALACVEEKKGSGEGDRERRIEPVLVATAQKTDETAPIASLLAVQIVEKDPIVIIAIVVAMSILASFTQFVSMCC